MQNFKSSGPLGPELKASPLSENLDFALPFLLDNCWTLKRQFGITCSISQKKLQLLENYEKNNFYHSKKMHGKSEYG